MNALTGTERPPIEASGCRMIHIVGLYKCGTSWLLHMLAAHPQVVAIREFDVLRAAFAPDRRLRRLPGSVLDYTIRRAGDPGWQARREAGIPRDSRAIFREMFLGRGLVPVMGADKQAQAAALPLEDLESMLDRLLAITGFKLRRSDGPLMDPSRHSNTLGVMNFRRGDLLKLMQRVRDSSAADDVAAIYFSSLRQQVEPGTFIACKAADQLMQLSLLQRASPDSRAIAIIRDGRDAAISARHFEALMRKRQAPWATGRSSYFRRLLGWSVRAAKLAEHARRGEVTVLRYEDLHRDFAGVCSTLLRELGLNADTYTVDSIRRITDFAAVSGGRRPGEAAEDPVRKGSVGEWESSLSETAAGLAWKLAGRELADFGYTQTGVVGPSPLVLGSV